MSPRSTLEIVRIVGELDISRKEELRAALRVGPQARAILVDLAEVTYADSTALSELLRFGSEAKRVEVAVALVVVTPQFMRVMRYAGLDNAFHVFGDRAAALAYLDAGS